MAMGLYVLTYWDSIHTQLIWLALLTNGIHLIVFQGLADPDSLLIARKTKMSKVQPLFLESSQFCGREP